MPDEKDKKLLELLAKNCKLTTKELSRKTGMPITTVHNRIKKLEEDGIIKGYIALYDYKKLGKMIQAFVQINVSYTHPNGGKFSQEDLAKHIATLPSVEECFIMTGTSDILIRVSTKDVEELNDLVINRLRNMDGIQNTVTAIVLKEIP